MADIAHWPSRASDGNPLQGAVEGKLVPHGVHHGPDPDEFSDGQDCVVTAGIFGLAGVLLGALLTIGWQWWSEKRQRDVMLRHIALALNDELLWIEAGLMRVLSGGPLDNLDRETGEVRRLWADHAATIAHFDTKTWSLVRVVMRMLDRLARIAEDHPPGTAMHPLERQMVAMTQTFLTEARQQLAGVSKTEAPPKRSPSEGADAYRAMMATYIEPLLQADEADSEGQPADAGSEGQASDEGSEGRVGHARDDKAP